jgi:hypothetical protein
MNDLKINEIANTILNISSLLIQIFIRFLNLRINQVLQYDLVTLSFYIKLNHKIITIEFNRGDKVLINH